MLHVSGMCSSPRVKLFLLFFGKEQTNMAPEKLKFEAKNKKEVLLMYDY